MLEDTGHGEWAYYRAYMGITPAPLDSGVGRSPVGGIPQQD